MDNMDLYQSSLDRALKLCLEIYQVALNAKANKKRCQQVAQRVKALEGLVFTLKKREQDGISSTAENALKELCNTLKSAKALIAKFSHPNTFANLMKSSSHDDQFYNVDERLIDNFQQLSGVFQIDKGNNPSTAAQPVSMTSMLCKPTAQMPQPNSMASMSCNPAAQMPQPNSMASMSYNPNASMLQPYSMHSMSYNSTAQMPQPNTMSQMTGFNPTAQMPQPNTMSQMMGCNPTAQMPQPNTMSQMMGFNPTAQMPQPNNASQMMGCNPTAQMPQPNTMSQMTGCNPTAQMPQPGNMNPMTMHSQTTPYPSQTPMPSMAMTNSISPLSSIPFANPTDPNSAMGMFSPMNVSTKTTSVVTNYGFFP